MAKFNITEAKTHFSKLVPLDKAKRPRKPGSGKGQILYVAPDFDATPKSFTA